MTAAPNLFKLGLFVLAGIATATGSIVAVGERTSRARTITYHSFFNESVQGLDVGSPVKYRGVTIGTVSAIRIAPDHRHIDVVQELGVRDIRRMGLTEGVGDDDTRFVIPPDLRAQLGSQGITGVKFILIDFFDVESNPPPELPFEIPRNYIPATPSLLKSLEDTLTKTMDQVPEIAQSIQRILGRIDGILEELRDKKVPDRIVATLEELNGAIASIRGMMDGISRSGAPEKLARTLDTVDRAVVKLDAVLARLDGEKGVIASAGKAMDAAYRFEKTADGRARELEGTLRDIGEAAQAIRDLADALEEDPDMLLKGRAKRKSP
jgi:phospholipid/cholesterol/gamma-HCH transport system substrate-binding protein